MKLRTILLSLLLSAVFVPLQAYDYNSNRTDFRDESIYFVITTRFYDGDPANNVLCWDNQDAQIETGDPCWRGDFAGLIDRLDYIKALGFSAIWITPVVQNASGYDYHGYHAMDFTRVDCRYLSDTTQGSEEDVDFQDLIDAAHNKGMKIILDVVFNHTGNFGEATLCPEFTRNYKIKNQADIDACMIPIDSVLGSDYSSLDASSQYSKRLAMMKNTDGNNNDTHNYWHHVGTQWNWDEPSRWWGQIAGDCVDLNTENNAVTDYLVKCYGEFIKMGVDGFRIDTSGHISRVTFNNSIIPQLAEIGEQYASKRLNEAPFYMYGEVCARYSEVTYRDQPVLSPYFYTWTSEESVLAEWNDDATWWDEQYVAEGDDPLGNMLVCLEEADYSAPTGNNTFMVDGAYHTPDYSESSGFNVIDFPLHYNFSTAASAYGLASSGDQYYNDATFNVVYVDSHDYGPQPNDAVRFSGDDAQWAENLSLMFTFRGIPCLYYGSEIGFRRGYTIDNGTNGALNNTGRAYFGGYITGDVTTTDFGEYTADGNALATLNHDLAQHLIRLNKMRQAVPALRKGQWTSDGCSSTDGGIAFKRAYKDSTTDSYALVSLNGGATFTNCPAGTYVDIVTGTSYTVASTSSTITVSAPSNQGQLRILVKDWTEGQIGEDGPFIYTSSSSTKSWSYDGTEEDGTDEYYTADDAVGSAKISFSPNGGNFKDDELEVTATLGGDAVSGTFTVSGVTYTLDESTTSATFTIGSELAIGETLTVTWTAVNSEGDEATGSVSFKRLDPNATITIYCAASSSSYYMYVWNDDEGTLTAAWPGDQFSSMSSTTINGTTYYYETFDADEVSVIFNTGSGGSQTGDITGITEDTYFSYSGGTSYSTVDVDDTSSSDDDDEDSGNGVTYYLACDANDWLGTSSDSDSSGSDTSDGDTSGSDTTSGITVYVNSSSSSYYMYAWDSNSNQPLGAWPGTQFGSMSTKTVDGTTYYYYTFTDVTSINVIFNTGNGGSQTSDITGITSDTYFTYSGGTTYTTVSVSSAKATARASSSTTTVWCSGSSSYYMYAWDSSNNSLIGSWPGTQFSSLSTKTVDGTTYYGTTFSTSPVSVIFNTGNGGSQTGDITGLTGTNYFSYSGGTSATTITGISDITYDSDYAFTAASDGTLVLELSSDLFGTTGGFKVYGDDGNDYSYGGSVSFDTEYTYAYGEDDATYLSSSSSNSTVSFVITTTSAGTSVVMKVVDGTYVPSSTSISNISTGASASALDVYSVGGSYFGTVGGFNDSRLKQLPAGIYIVGGQKYIVK